MTSASAFHFETLVWDWPIAIYLFLIGISAGLVTLAILLRRFHPAPTWWCGLCLRCR